MLFLRNTGVAPPSRPDVEELDVGADAERQAQARRHERLVVRRVDLVEGVVFGFDAATGPVELGPGLVERGDVLLGRVVDLVGGRRRLDVGTRRHLAGRARSELPDEIAVANAHVDDQLLGAVSGSEQVVARRQLQQLANVRRVLDQRHAGEQRAVASEHAREVLRSEPRDERRREP